MSESCRFPPDRDPLWYHVIVLAVAATIAAAGARDYAGAWNDGSRLATVESLVDRGTLAIDDSIFVHVSHESTPYAPDDPFVSNGTADKLWIDGHFYSDKSPVPALWLAIVYKAWETTTGRTARESPNQFCYLMTLTSSGLAYVVAVWCLFALGRWVGLSRNLRLLLTASFSLATVAPVYARQVNNHILLLGVAAALTFVLVRAAAAGSGGMSARVLLIAGALTGLGYTIDLGVGPVLVLCTVALVLYRCRQVGSAALFVTGMLPWVVLHHALNYSVGGTFKPANAVPEYLRWPGSPFTLQNMTGTWNHSPGHFVVYAAALLLGKQGFLGHNLALFLAILGMAGLLRRRLAERPELLWAGCWSGGSWLAYAVSSTNYSGLCCSIRWFVPLLAPGYFALAVLLRERPRCRSEFLVLSSWGALLTAIAWCYGPWIKHMVPLFWPIQAAALVSWLAVRWSGVKWRSNARPAEPQALVDAA